MHEDAQMTTIRSPRGWTPPVQRALVQVIFPARSVAIIALAAVVPFVSTIGPERWWLAAGLVTVLLPLHLGFQVWSERHGRFPPAMPLIDQVLAFAVVLLFPETFAGVAIVLLADNALTALIFGRRLAVLVSLIGSGLLTLAAFLVDAPNAAVVLAGTLIASFTSVWIIGNAGEWERATGARFAALVGELDVVVWETVPGSDRLSYVSPAASAILGYDVADWYVPGFWQAHLHPDDAARTVAAVQAAVAAGEDHTLEYRMIHRDGHAVHVRDVASVELDGSGAAVLVRGVMVDVSDRRRAEEQLRQQATHDPLTGLANRSLLADHLDLSLREARRTGDPLALLVLDLDGFKEINDALGHEAGDRLLASFATRLRHELRDADTIARLGGDEFAVLLTTDADIAGASAVANRVLELAERPLDVAGLQLQARVSIGIAVHPDHGKDAAELSSRADVAMYLAKRSGSGIAVYHPELDRSSGRRLSLVGHLREAIDAEQLSLRFQPCFDLASGRVVATEALVRWSHPVHGEVGPDEFIRLAEMSGLIQPLSRWVIARAVEHLAGAPERLQVSANLSVRNLAEPDLVPWLAELVSKHEVPPGRLVLELTETEMMNDITTASVVLREIADLGIGLAIDDFGAGQSALAYLRSLPVEELKLDRALVGGVGTNQEAAAICEAIVRLGHQLDLRVVAEGVSSASDVAALRRMGCDRAQGFFLGEPRSIERLHELEDLTIADAFAGDQTPQ
jgi:diguanylate cyclase (GGDEF)-like protein/PAS domain S-box-containing protein